MSNFSRNTLTLLITAATLSLAAPARADSVNDWNIKAGDIVTEAKIGTPPAIRIMAIVQTAVHDAVTAAAAVPGALPDAAVAAANRATMAKLMPGQQASIEAAYQAALAKLPDGSGKAAGIEAGERAAAAVLARRADDGAATPESYRPHTTPGAYVPTVIPAVPQWPNRKPWILRDAAQLRPAAPPALDGGIWVRDYNEVRELGARNSTKRTAEQTEAARFWEYSLPAIYHGVVRSVTTQPGRDLARNARLLAAVAQAMDDAMIALFDAKYHYNFWRPTTAIRNGDRDGNDATPREAAWLPLIDVPMHPEYPSGHGILAGVIGPLLKADAGSAPLPVLSTSSPSAKGATRRWNSPEEFAQEVAVSRIHGGLHFRTAVEVALDMGRQIGQLTARQHFGATR